MPYQRTTIARTPLLAWERLVLQGAMPDWGPEYRPGSPRLLLPLEHCLQCELHGKRLVVDGGTALWLTPQQPYRLRQPFSGQRSTVLALPLDDARLERAPRRCRITPLHRHRLALLAAQADALALEEGVSGLLDELLDERLPAFPVHAAVERARQFIAEDPTRREGLAAIANAAACSPFHLARQFRRHTGRSLHAYRDDLRLSLALQRLSAGASSLAQLALELGYAHHSHFSAAFKRCLGLTPSQMRRISTAAVH